MAAHDHDHNEGSNLSEMELRVRAIETILVEKGYIETAAIDRIIELYETKIGPHIGAQVIAKAWSDPAFRQSLLEDASKAVGTLAQVGRVGDHLILHGAHVFPDSVVAGKGEDPQWLYTVRFDAQELWGAGAEPKLKVSIEAFEPYLEHV